MQVVQTDIVVVGGGGAGLRAAISEGPGPARLPPAIRSAP